MDEAQIKAATLACVRKASGRGKKPVVSAEFTLGSSGVRADLAVFSEETIGLEIKSDKDSLRRLPSQMYAYARYFDHVIAIIAPCHLKHLEIEQLYGASVWTYNQKGALILLHQGVKNTIEEAALLDVLTQAERRKGDFRSAIEARYGDTSREFWSSVARRPICPDDLPSLSRFSVNRARARQWAAQRETRWSHWLAAQACLETA